MLEPPDPPPRPVQDTADRPLIYASADLLQGRREVWIEHGGDMYRLRLTSAGKVYMSK